MSGKPTKATEGKAAAKGSKLKLNTLTIKDLSAPDERARKIKGGLYVRSSSSAGNVAT